MGPRHNRHTMSLETSIIGLALLGDRLALLDLDPIQPHHFADTRNQALWKLIQDYKEKNPAQGLDPILLADQLPTLTEARVDDNYLLDCLHDAPIAALAPIYVEKLLNETARRGLHAACTRGLQILEAKGDPSDAEAEIRDLLNQVSTGAATLVDNRECLDQLTDFTITTTPHTPTPWPELNNLLGGWKPGGLYIIGARPGAGKTIMALQSALALTETGHVYLASLEMTGRELWSRIMAQVADVPGAAVTRKRWPTKDERSRMEAAAPHLKQLPIHFDERANLTIGDFVATTRLLHREHTLKAAFVDYIGLINAAPGDRRQRWELIGDYTRTLKNLAKDLQIPIIAVAQLGRQAEQRPGGELSLSDLRESGNIE